MAHNDAKRITKKHKQLQDYNDVEGELLHDGYGDQYLVNTDQYKQQLDQRRNSESKEQDLELAREILHSNLRQLTERQRDVMYYVMQKWTQKKIAEKLDISQTAVSQHLQAARTKLAQLITSTKQVLKEGLHGSDNID